MHLKRLPVLADRECAKKFCFSVLFESYVRHLPFCSTVPNLPGH